MAYSKDNLVCLFGHDGTMNGTWKLWLYKSADAIATVNTAGYIDNAYDMGMRRNDMIIVVDTTNNLTDLCVVSAAITASVTTADLSDGLRITATNSD